MTNQNEPEADHAMTMGRPRLSAEQHQRAGSYREDRHGPQARKAAADRAWAVRGLSPFGRRIVDDLIASYTEIDLPLLFLIRSYALSCQRLEQLQSAKHPKAAAIDVELTITLSLLRELGLNPDAGDDGR